MKPGINNLVVLLLHDPAEGNRHAAHEIKRYIEELETAARHTIEDAEDMDKEQRLGYAKVNWKSINELKRAMGVMEPGSQQKEGNE